jgi:hypothetical protein
MFKDSAENPKTFTMDLNQYVTGQEISSKPAPTQYKGLDYLAEIYPKNAREIFDVHDQINEQINVSQTHAIFAPFSILNQSFL